jgi:hypothetical protein
VCGCACVCALVYVCSQRRMLRARARTPRAYVCLFSSVSTHV